MGVTFGRGPDRLRTPAAAGLVRAARWSPGLLGGLLFVLGLALAYRFARR